jgi:hypothetical protein
MQHLPGSKLTNVGFLVRFEACHYLHRSFTALSGPFLRLRATIFWEIGGFSTSALDSACLRFGGWKKGRGFPCGVAGLLCCFCHTCTRLVLNTK